MDNNYNPQPNNNYQPQHDNSFQPQPYNNYDPQPDNNYQPHPPVNNQAPPLPYYNRFQQQPPTNNSITKPMKVYLIGLGISALLICTNVLTGIAYLAFLTFSVLFTISFTKYVKEKNMRNTGVASGGFLAGCGTAFALFMILSVLSVISYGVSESGKEHSPTVNDPSTSISSEAVSSSTSSISEATDADDTTGSINTSSRTTSSDNSSTEESKSESKADHLSKEEYITLVKDSISGTIGENEKFTDIRLNDTNLHIGVDLSGAKIDPNGSVTEEDIAVNRACSITDKILTLDTSLWDSVTIDFEGIGTITRKKSEIVTSEHGSCFEIDHLDTYEKSSSSSVASESNASKEQVIFNNNGIIITYLGIEKGWLGDCVKLRIENNSGKNYTIQTRDTSVNGYMVDDIFSCDVISGKIANDKIQFLSSDFEENGISEINNIEFSFHVFNSDDWMDDFDTVPIIINP